MNAFDNDNELKQLLDSIEYAGRDQRREDTLAQMLDQLAEQEAPTTKHRTRLLRWVGYAAAACVVLMLGLGLMLRLLDGDIAQTTGSQLPIVASNETPRQLDTVIDTHPADMTPKASTPATVRKQRQIPQSVPSIQHEEPLMADATAVEATLLSEEEEDTIFLPYIVEELLAEQTPANDPVETIAAPVTSVSHTTTPASDTVGQQPKSERKSGIGALLARVFRSKPSEMDGTLLAFNLL